MEDTTGTTVKDQVLVGVDGSENCARAFDIALAVAKRRGWSMRLVGGYLIPSLGYESGPVVAQNYEKVLEDHARVPLDALAEVAEADGVDVSTSAVAEHAADALVRETADAGLVVVGKRGRNRFAGRFLGSVSAALAAHSHCPTLVIPEKWETPDPTKLLAPRQEQPGGEDAEAEPTQLLTESTPPKPRGPGFQNVDEEMNFRQEVVVGVDLSDDAERVALVAAHIAELFGRPLTLVAAASLNADAWYPNPVEYNAQIPTVRHRYTDHLAHVAQRVSAEHPELGVHWQFFDGSPAGVLSEASRTASVVALGTRGHGGFAGLLLGSVSQAVLNRSVSPVLVVPTLKNAG